MSPVTSASRVDRIHSDNTDCLLCATSGRRPVLEVADAPTVANRHVLSIGAFDRPFRANVRVRRTIRHKKSDPRLFAVTILEAADRWDALQKIRAQVWRIYGRVPFEIEWLPGTPGDDRPRLYPSAFSMVFPGREARAS